MGLFGSLSSTVPEKEYAARHHLADYFLCEHACMSSSAQVVAGSIFLLRHNYRAFCSLSPPLSFTLSPFNAPRPTTGPPTTHFHSIPTSKITRATMLSFPQPPFDELTRGFIPVSALSGCLTVCVPLSCCGGFLVGRRLQFCNRIDMVSDSIGSRRLCFQGLVGFWLMGLCTPFPSIAVVSKVETRRSLLKRSQSIITHGREFPL